ncbi:hypothetical protein RUND412_001056 [Rhizina undulata]
MPKTPTLSVTPASDENDRMEGVARPMGQEESERLSIRTYSPANTSPSPLQRYTHYYKHPMNLKFPSSSTPSLLDQRSCDEGSRRSEGAGSFTQFTDESRNLDPRRSRESGITNYSRTKSSCYMYEPFEYGVAVTSSWVEGPGAERRELREKYLEVQEVEKARGQRQRAKLVDFKKGRISTLEEKREGDRNSGYLGHMTFL